jgi:hypothetical protein
MKACGGGGIFSKTKFSQKFSLFEKVEQLFLRRNFSRHGLERGSWLNLFFDTETWAYFSIFAHNKNEARQEITVQERRKIVPYEPGTYLRS